MGDLSDPWLVGLFLSFNGNAIDLEELAANVSAMTGLSLNQALVQHTGYRNHIEVARFGFPESLFLREHTTDVAVYHQVFESPHYRMRFEANPSVIIDAGAHIGLASVYFAHRFPEARIIALEPAKDNFEMLQKNTEGYSNVTALNCALWGRDGTLQLEDPGNGNWAYRVAESSASSKDEVEAVTMASLMDRFALEQIDFLKVDIEGAEREVFLDASAWIKQVRSIAVELHEVGVPGCGRSFYNATNGFDREWFCFESACVTRGTYMQPPEGVPGASSEIIALPDS